VDAGRLDTLARSLRRAQWLVEELDHNRSPVAIAQVVSGLRLELLTCTSGVAAEMAAQGLDYPAEFPEPHSGLPAAPEALF
jgi:hypothetical protein